MAGTDVRYLLAEETGPANRSWEGPRDRRPNMPLGGHEGWLWSTHSSPAYVHGRSRIGGARPRVARLGHTTSIRAATGQAMSRIAVTGRRIHTAGGAVRTRLRNGSRGRDTSPGHRGQAAAAPAAGRDRSPSEVRRITGEVVGLAGRAVTEPEHLLINARRALRRTNRRSGWAAAISTNANAGRRRGYLQRAVNDTSPT